MTRMAQTPRITTAPVTIREAMQRLWDAADARSDGIADAFVEGFTERWFDGDGDGDGERALGAAIRLGYLVAVRRTHCGDWRHLDHNRYYARKGARP